MIAKEACKNYNANQHEPELRQMLNLIPTGQKIVVEIGVEHGGTFYCWSRIADKNATLIGIDLDIEPLSGPWADRHNPTLEELKAIALPTQTVHLIKGRSQDADVHKKLLFLLGNQTIDLLHIDGDHSFKGCKTDFDLYSPFVNGTVVFHDIDTRYPLFDVHKFWKELQGDKKEVILTPGVRGFGILKT